MICKLRLQVNICSLLVSVVTFVDTSFPFPKIAFTDWIDDTNLLEIQKTPPPLTDYGQNGYVVPTWIHALTITCTASYPIEWNLEDCHKRSMIGGSGRRAKIDSGILLRTSRNASDIFNERTFVYSLQLSLYGEENILTGNYSCQKVNDEMIASSIYIFWEGSSPPYLLKSNEKFHYIVHDEKISNSLTIPCRVSNPEAKVILTKTETNNSVHEVPIGPNCQYDPRIGFTLTGQNFLGAYFICTANLAREDDILDFVIIPVYEPAVLGNFSGSGSVINRYKPKEEFKDRLLYNASVYYDTHYFKFVCCSITSHPPRLVHYICATPTICELYKQSLYMAEVSVDRSIDGSCSTFKLPVAESGVFRCVGDGIDVFRQYVFPLSPSPKIEQSANFLSVLVDTQNNPYMSWSQIEPEKLMIIFPAVNRTLYSGMSSRFECQVSRYYFANGLHWMVTWKNGTKSVNLGKRTTMFLSGQYGQYHKNSVEIGNRIFINLVANTSMESLSCFAPVWNSTAWIKKTYNLTISEPIFPTIDGPEVTKVTWYVNDTNMELVCHFNGDPKPGCLWYKGNQSLYGYKTLFDVTSKNYNSTLKIQTVTKGTQGTYKCVVKNVGAKVTKIIHVVVKERISAGFVAAVMSGVLGSLGGTAIIIFLVKQNYDQKRKIRHLTQVAFKDMHATMTSSNTDASQNASDFSPTPEFSENQIPEGHVDVDIDTDFLKTGSYHKL